MNKVSNVKKENLVELTLRTYEVMINRLNDEFKKAEDMLEIQEMLKISYHINCVTEAYEKLRANSDGTYVRSMFFREELNHHIANNNMVGVLDVAKKFGYTQRKICEDLSINQGNVSAYKRGSLNSLSKGNVEKIFQYVFNLVN